MSKGFTLVEMLVVIAVTAIIAVIGVSSLANVNTSKAVDIEVEKVVTLITKARSLTMAAKDNVVYGIHFEAKKVVLFKGSTYSAGTSTNQSQPLNAEVKISATALTGGGAEVVFKKLTGATSQSGTITLAAVRKVSQTKVITILGTGIAYGN